MALIGWDRIFNFDDKTPLNEARAEIERLEQTISKMVDTASAKFAQYADEISSVKDEAQKLIGVTTALSTASATYEDQLLQTAKVSEGLISRQQTLNKLNAENKEQLNDLSGALELVNKAKKKFADETQAEVGSMDDLRQRLIEAEKAYKALGPSADASVKEAHLQKVRDLAARHGALNKELNNAKKASVVAAGSYNELSKRVQEAARRMREMEGGMQANSKEFKELRKYVAENTEKLKDWDSAIGQSTRRVGDYAGEISRIIPGLGGMAGGIDMVTKASWAFIATPVGAIIAAIAVTLGILTKATQLFFDGSLEGQEKLNELTARWDALMHVASERMQVLGREVVAFFENPAEGIKKLGNLITENITNRIEGLWKMLKGEFSFDNWIQGVTGITNATEKLTKAQEDLNRAEAQYLALNEKRTAFRKAEILDQIEDSKTEIQISELLERSRDKLRATDDQRFRALRTASALMREMTQGDLELANQNIAIRQQEFILAKGSIESYQALADAIEARNQIQTKAAEQRRTLLKQEIQFIREAEAEYVAAEKRRNEAIRISESFRLNEAIRANDQLIKDVRSSGTQVIQAMVENEQLKIEQLRVEESRALDAAKEAALARVELDADTLDRIYQDRSLSAQQIIELERAAREKILQGDKEWLQTQKQIQDEYGAKVKQVNDDTTRALDENVFKMLERDARKLLATVNGEISQASAALNNAFAGGAKTATVGGVTYDISSLKQFAKAREQVEFEMERKSYLNLLQTQKDKLAALQAHGLDVSEQLAAIYKTEEQLAKQSADNVARSRAEMAEAMKRTMQTLQDTLLASIDQFNENAQIRRDEELERIDMHLQKELEMAGDNKERQAEIENRYELQRAAVEAQGRIAKMRAARFEKALALLQAGVNTAQAVTVALRSAPPPANFILAAAVGALGAVQIAAIASKPIPQFKQGSEYTPEGWAIVHGSEIVERPREAGAYFVKGGKDEPHLTYLEKGSRVHTADAVERMKVDRKYDDLNNVMTSGSRVIEKYLIDRDGKEVTEAINRNFNKLDNTIRKKESAYVNVTVVRGEFDFNFMKEEYK